MSETQDMSEPAVVAWRAALGQSTSAQLRETQAALAASQADLTRMEAKRDQAIENGDYWNREWKQASAERDALAQHNAELKAEVLQAGTDRVKHTEREQQLRRMLTDAELDLKAAGDDAEKQGGEQDRQAEYIATLERALSTADTTLDTAMADAQELRRQLAGVEHDLEHARFERDRARAWQVARNDDTGACFLCGRPIVRGQAVEPQPGTTKGSWSHVECPGGTR